MINAVQQTHSSDQHTKTKRCPFAKGYRVPLVVTFSVKLNRLTEQSYFTQHMWLAFAKP